MFNFLVTGMAITEPRGSFTMGYDRVFQYTDVDLKERFAPNRLLNESALLELPTIITNESSWDPEVSVLARIGKITKVRRGSGGFTIEYSLDADIPPIPNFLLERLAPQLHLELKSRGSGFGDFGTNHWAVKDADLFRVLFAEGVGRLKPNVFNLTNETAKQDLVSVMMPFDANLKSVYNAIQQAASDAGMRCARADDIWNHDTIIQDVVQLISTATVVVCDLSGKNANVFYETGIAHTLGKNVILLAQHESDVPFDLRHIRYIRYLPNDEGLASLVPKISDRLRELSTRPVS